MDPDQGPFEMPDTVVLLVMDALDAGHLHHLGYHRETTPRLDALAAQGVTFTEAMTPAPYTVASIPSILTGRLPDRHGLVHKSLGQLAEEEVTLAERFAAAGFRTFGATANPNGGIRRNVHQGFEEFLEVCDGPGPEGAVQVEVWGETMHIPKGEEMPPVFERFLDQRREGERLFVYLHLLEPHTDYTPPEPFFSRWIDPEYDGPFASGRVQPMIDEASGRLTANAADRQATLDLYDANLAYGDHCVGLLLDLLVERGLYDGALIALTADHGEALWQHGLWGHNRQLFEESVHVPLIVKFPGQSVQGVRVDDLVGLIDLAPSLLEWAGLPPPADANFDGLRLQPLVDEPGSGDPERELLLRSAHALPHLALRTRERKLILMPQGVGNEPANVRWYDLIEDRGERRNLAGEMDGSTRGRVTQLEELASTFHRRAKGEELEEGVRDALLEALGYGGDDDE